MSADVVSLNARVAIGTPGHPDKAVVDACEDLLARARSGDVCGVVIVKMHADGTSEWERHGYLHPYPVVGAIEAAKKDMLP